MLETIEYNSIRGHVVGGIPKEIQPIIAQKLKPLLENSELIIKSAKETYGNQLKVLLPKTLLLRNYFTTNSAFSVNKLL